MNLDPLVFIITEKVSLVQRTILIEKEIIFKYYKIRRYIYQITIYKNSLKLKTKCLKNFIFRLY